MGRQAVHALEHWLLSYRRIWRGSVFNTVLMPLLYFAGMGLGVGVYVDQARPPALGGATYLAYIAPGLLATGAFQVMAGEMSWPVFAALRWGQQYKAMQASPLRPVDILLGHVAFGLLRATSAAVAFFVVMVVFGLVRSPVAAGSIGAGALTALAVSGWIFTVSITARTDGVMSLIFRFGVIPVTLFSGVFFPASQLPLVIRPIAWLSPLWHGTELARSMTLGGPPPWPAAIHLASLLAWSLTGLYLARRIINRKLSV
jgi:lipooligosaccharide transport system permease protein